MDYQSVHLNKMIVYVVFYLLSQLLPVQSGVTIPKTNFVALLSPYPTSLPPVSASPTPPAVVLGNATSLAPAPIGVNLPTDAESVTLKRVVDGDTLQILYNGKSTKLRLIGINTPEVVDPRKPVQCFGKEASNHAKELLTDKQIFIKADPSQADKDKFDRLLRYVWLADGTSLNYQMIAQGYAYEYTYDVPYLYQKEFQKAQQDAQNAQLGLWSKTTCSGNL